MNRLSKILRVLFCLAVPIFAAMSAFAAEEGGSPVNQPIGTTFKWIHFVILAGLAYWLFAKVLPPVFKRNAENISAAITKATAARAEADRRLNEAAAKLASLEKEVAEFRAEALREAAAEAERLRNSARLDGRTRRPPGIESHRRNSRRGRRRIARRQTNDSRGAGRAHQQFRADLAGEAQLKSASLQYANALADIALQQGAAEPVLKQLSELNTTLGGSAELRNFLESPAVSRADKHAVVEKIAARLGSSKILRNFLFVVVDHRRTAALPEMIESFQQVIRQRQGLAEAQVASAAPLSDAQKSNLLQTLERKTGKKLQATYSLDPALLGGAVVRIGDTIYDGSLKNRLNQMRARLAAE